MIKTMTRMMAATAALGLVAAPIVAQANTRAGDSSAVYSTANAAPGLGRAADGEAASEAGVSIIVALLAGAAIIGGILYATGALGDDNSDDVSPGT